MLSIKDLYITASPTGSILITVKGTDRQGENKKLGMSYVSHVDGQELEDFVGAANIILDK
jgi:hypothetical protein